jgi:hypothetical protein
MALWLFFTAARAPATACGLRRPVVVFSWGFLGRKLERLPDARELAGRCLSLGWLLALGGCNEARRSDKADMDACVVRRDFAMVS